MFSKCNLAFAKYNSYNCEKDEINIQKLLMLKFGNSNYLSLTKKTLIMRENILASGMEPTDIDKAYEITQNNTRR